MELTPRYGDDPVITLDGSPADILAPTVRQRRRMAAALASFTDEQWAHPSRCEGWSNRDVIVHLDSTNRFWAYSVAEGVRGEPTRFLASFDPVTGPAQLVAGAGDMAPSEVLARFTASTDALETVLTALDDEAWSAPAEAPPGHLSVSAVVHHALWDSWVHERDILLPMGISPDEEPDEIAASLRYVAGLIPALAVNWGAAGTGTLAIDATDPDLFIVVEVRGRAAVRAGDAVSDLRLTGGAVDLLEALSVRRPLDQAIPAESAWMLSALSRAFDSEPA